MALSVAAGKVAISEPAIDALARDRLGPIGRDLDGRAIRIARQMKSNASARPGPEIRTSNLHDAIGILRFGADAQSLYADIGPQHHRMQRRGYNYALILEGIFPRGGAPPDGAYPFMERSLEAGR